MKKIKSFKLMINNEGQGGLESFKKITENNGRWSIFEFKFSFIFDKDKYESSGHLLIGITRFLRQFKLGQDNFFFDDGNRYYLIIKFRNRDRLCIQVSEGPSDSFIEEYELNTLNFLESLIKTLKSFVNELNKIKNDEPAYIRFLNNLKDSLKETEKEMQLLKK